MTAYPPLFESDLRSLPLVHRGKVRDIYTIDAEHWLIVASDRLSAFDVVLPTPIPGKGALLTQLSNFWFNRFKTLIPNHLQLATVTLEQALPDADERAAMRDRAIVVRRLRALPIEAVVRGYLIGSGFKDYQHSGAVCGILLPANLRQADRLPTPIFTPATKAAVGQHDENIDFDQAAALIGNTALAEQVRAISLTLYKTAAAHAQERGIIIADTKFEFGLDEADRLVLIDEALTPDSSRFWPAESYQPGMSPPSFDKQFVRDYLETLAWDKTAPGPTLPDAIVAKTAAIYQQALERLTRLN